MKKYLARLNPMERRFVIGVMAVLVVVLNIVFVRPHFSDWSETKKRLSEAQTKLVINQAEIAQTNNLARQIKSMEKQGADVAQEDQAIDLLSTVHLQSSRSGVDLEGASPRPTTHTNQFFLEQVQTFSVKGDESSMVDFLYGLGAGNSTIRVRDITIRAADQQRQKLGVSVTLVASYQKKPAARNAGSAAAATAKSAPPTQR